MEACANMRSNTFRHTLAARRAAVPGGGGRSRGLQASRGVCQGGVAGQWCRPSSATRRTRRAAARGRAPGRCVRGRALTKAAVVSAAPGAPRRRPAARAAPSAPHFGAGSTPPRRSSREGEVGGKKGPLREKPPPGAPSHAHRPSAGARRSCGPSAPTDARVRQYCSVVGGRGGGGGAGRRGALLRGWPQETPTRTAPPTRTPVPPCLPARPAAARRGASCALLTSSLSRGFIHSLACASAGAPPAQARRGGLRRAGRAPSGRPGQGWAQGGRAAPAGGQARRAGRRAAAARRRQGRTAGGRAQGGAWRRRRGMRTTSRTPSTLT